ncbi:GAF domain-containing protein [Mycolicibacterium palauense]|uniref:GAF domain-containing protein n=1 Tax=Mycolicibacterium palauense TaxID=2034511 RepID=UPI000BFF04EF|nr:helix-turn-helix domain-containing protein [Mycolicibacterium palauense]
MPHKQVQALHKLVVAGQVDPAALGAMALRGLVADSWRRSLSTGVDPDRQGPHSRNDTELERLRRNHPLTRAMPLIRRLLVQDAAEAGHMVGVADAGGTLMWVEGDRRACRRGEEMNFLPGADWSERSAGTNAPGTALVLDREVQIRRWEHFSRVAQPWSCTASPVRDPTTGELLGVIDLTGQADAATSQTLALLRATAFAVGKHVALQRLAQTAVPTGLTVWSARVTALGAGRPTWSVCTGAGAGQTSTLAPRHADILVLLMQHPEGLSADHLAVLLDNNDLDAVSVRAEMSRLRRAIGARFLGSKPYRLLEPVTSDLDGVLDALAGGDVARAMDLCGGPLLPNSTSPGIARLRVELRAALRQAAIDARDDAVLARWARLDRTYGNPR